MPTAQRGSPSPPARLALIPLAVVADATGEDLLEPRALGARSAARSPYSPVRSRPRPAAARTSRCRPRTGPPATRREDWSRSGSAACTPPPPRRRGRRSTPRSPDAITSPSVVKHESTACGRLVAGDAAPRVRVDVAPSTRRSPRTPSASGRTPGRGRASVNQMTWFEASPSTFSIRCRVANDCCVLCMSSSSSRYGRRSMTGMSMSPWNCMPEVYAARIASQVTRAPRRRRRAAVRGSGSCCASSTGRSSAGVSAPANGAPLGRPCRADSFQLPTFALRSRNSAGRDDAVASAPASPYWTPTLSHGTRAYPSASVP